MIGSVTAEVLDEGRFTVLTVPEPSESATHCWSQKRYCISAISTKTISSPSTRSTACTALKKPP